jgi:hypothetical protein
MTELDRLVRRLRSFPPRAWQDPARGALVRRLAADLAAVGAPGHVPPDLPDHVLADAVAVLAADAMDANAARAAGIIRAALDALR